MVVVVVVRVVGAGVQVWAAVAARSISRVSTATARAAPIQEEAVHCYYETLTGHGRAPSLVEACRLKQIVFGGIFVPSADILNGQDSKTGECSVLIHR